MKRIGLLALGILLYVCAQIAQADWMPAKRLTWTSGASHSAAIALDSMDQLHLVLGDETPGNYEVYYKRSTNGGSTWTAAIRLTWN
jgi:hypothetical protein